MTTTERSGSQSVDVKLGGALVEYAPAGQTGSKHAINISDSTTVQQVLDQLGVPAEQPLMIILNDAMVARPDYQSTLLSDGDALALMPPIKAG